jgi:two-component system, CAI-1 autoinducer sensor kinase/phosphatase CqsS
VTSYSIAPLVSSVLFLLLCFFIVQHRFKSLNLTYAFFTFLTAWWQGSWAVLFNVHDPKLADFIVRVGYSGITFLPVAYYHFVVELLKLKDRRKLVLFSYGIAIVFLLLLWNSNLYVDGFYKYDWGYYPKAGILHPIYLVFLNVLAFQGFYLPYKFSKQTITNGN